MKTKAQIRSVRFIESFIVLSLLFVSLNGYAQTQWSSVVSNNFNSTNSGNIGIGAAVTASDAKLTITGAAAVWQLSLKNSSAGAGNWIVGSSATAWAVGGGKFLICNTAASTDAAFTIDASKNVGISRTSPVYKLDVNGAVNASSFLLNGVAFTQPWTTSGGNINYPTGIVSIGTATAPTGYKLAVGGKAIAEEVVVKLQANWPDYVFDEDYKLPSLLELGKFIRENKHLPGVPTENEVKENGVSLGEMNGILLKKIEELTLYIVAQEKRIQALEKTSR